MSNLPDPVGLDRAREEMRRRDAAERAWLSTTTLGRPSIAEAESLDHQGIPACHVWQVPDGEAPPHLSATSALRLWQDGACSMCSARPERLRVDHCHSSGLVRGLLCTSCNTAEGLTNSSAFAAYRERPPAVILGIEEQYGAVWDGLGVADDYDADQRNAAHVDAAEVLFTGVADRFRLGT